jgi:hypothetical protein
LVCLADYWDSTLNASTILLMTSALGKNGIYCRTILR